MKNEQPLIPIASLMDYGSTPYIGMMQKQNQWNRHLGLCINGPTNIWNKQYYYSYIIKEEMMSC